MEYGSWRMGRKNMTSNTAAKKLLCFSLMIFLCLFASHDVSAPENLDANHVSPNETSTMIEKQYRNPNNMESVSSISEPIVLSILEPTAEPTPESTVTPARTPTPAPTSAPKPTVPLFPTPEPVPTLTEEMILLMTSDQLERSDLAYRILNNPRITLATIHPSGVRDNAFAYNNIVDTYFGKPALRRKYKNAPGGSVYLSTKMLNTILLLAEKYTFTITESAGASHSKTSNHYDGLAFDVGTINGRYASNNSISRAFASDAKNIGATSTVIESTCVHIDFK